VISKGYVTGLGLLDSIREVETEIKKDDLIIVVIKSLSVTDKHYKLKVEFERPDDMTLFYLLIASLIAGILTLTCIFCCIICIHRSKRAKKTEKLKSSSKTIENTQMPAFTHI